ncbi:MAG: OsmC family peroxiredoxin [Chlamydiae bacterium]|nr:OsmC family peroxiredoxin [Chlamydiota bacterium]
MVQLDIEYLGELSTRIVHGANSSELVTCAPKDHRGIAESFSPTDLLAAALGSCILILMAVAARKSGADVTGLRASIEKEMISTPVRRVGKMVVHVSCPRSFSFEVQQALEAAGKGCPVHHSLHPDTIQEFHFQWGHA